MTRLRAIIGRLKAFIIIEVSCNFLLDSFLESSKLVINFLRLSTDGKIEIHQSCYRLAKLANFPLVNKPVFLLQWNQYFHSQLHTHNSKKGKSVHVSPYWPPVSHNREKESRVIESSKQKRHGQFLEFVTVVGRTGTSVEGCKSGSGSKKNTSRWTAVKNVSGMNF